MKRSVRTTFIGLFIGLMAIVLLAVWAMNSFFLEKYYLNDKLNILQDTYTQINAYAMEKAAAGEDIMDDLQSLYSKDGEQNVVCHFKAGFFSHCLYLTDDFSYESLFQKCRCQIRVEYYSNSMICL